MATKTKMRVGPGGPTKPKSDLKPGEKREPSTYKPFNEQGGIESGSIRKMTAADTLAAPSLSKPGKRIDLTRSTKAIQSGSPVYAPAYIKLATPAKPKVKPAVKTEAKPTETKVATKTVVKPAAKTTTTAPAPKKVEAPKERVAYRTQTIIDASGKKSVKSVAYSKFDEKAKKWVEQDAPLVIDYRTKEKKYNKGKVVKF